ncbi:MAG: D-alanine--D-alanine ligase [Oscillospiraceae bacterium]|jgi:D-alanine-D-alanine ligase|nr:D-alanine--D-alanine ligase [Oscillospiraceae bacterium]
MKIKLGLFFGGNSVEHEVSVISALQAYNSFDKSRYDVIPIYITRENEFYTGEYTGRIEQYRDIPALLKKSVRILPVSGGDKAFLQVMKGGKVTKRIYDHIDIAFPVVHGTNVEDGALQGYFRTLRLPFAGCDVSASALGMDKYAQKLMYRAAGIPVREGKRFHTGMDRDEILSSAAELGFPLIVKPASLGSSVGISSAADGKELAAAVDLAFEFDTAIVVETAVQNLREINCAVLGDRDEAKASECEEPSAGEGILSYEDKYVSSGKSGKGMSGAVRLLPAPITPEQREKVRNYALAAFKALDCSGVARVDFLMDGKTGEIWINEINTNPGSLSFYLWEAAGLKYARLLDELVSLALKRERERASLHTAVETGILADFNGGIKAK